MKNQPIRVVHVITDLDTGGAEMMLLKLLSAMDSNRFHSTVISLTGIGPVGEKITRRGIEVQSLGMKPGSFNPLVVARLAGMLRGSSTDLVQTWMYHADLIGGLAALLAGKIPVLWNIRNSDLDPETSKRSTRFVVRLNAILSHWLPKRILICSKRARAIHLGIGFDDTKMVLLPNGFDLAEFQPDLSAGEWLKTEWGLGPEKLIVGLAARFDPQKDIRTFLEAARLTAEKIPNVHFLLCGEGMTADNVELAVWIDSEGINDQVHLMGRRSDMPRVTAAFDLAVSSSAYGEAFSNVLGEAMACEVPCVATDVGDSAAIIADTGLVVPPRNPLKLADAMVNILTRPAEERRELGRAARKRVRDHYDLKIIASDYARIYQEVLG